jgi:hypothetical protein
VKKVCGNWCESLNLKKMFENLFKKSFSKSLKIVGEFVLKISI